MQKEFDVTNLNIDGIDTALALKNCGDSPEAFFDILDVYYKTGHEKAGTIKALYQANNIHDFMIEVHGLKGTSLVIGAKTLSDHARALEYAARDVESGNRSAVDYISSNLDTFIQNYLCLLDRIKPYIIAENPHDNNIEMSKEMIKEKIDLIINYLESFSIDEAEELLESLSFVSTDNTSSKLISQALASLRSFNYDEATKYLLLVKPS